MNDEELLNAMKGLLAKTNTAAPAALPELAGWAQQTPQTGGLIQGVGIPAKISRGRGTLKITLWLPPACASSPAALNAALDQLENAGITLDVWEPSGSGWGSGRGNWNGGRGSWGSGRGGWGG